LGTVGTTTDRATGESPAAIVYEQSGGRGTPDSVRRTLEAVACGAIVELGREARRRAHGLAGEDIPAGLCAPTLCVVLPADWADFTLDDIRSLARAWVFAFDPTDGRVLVWRSEKLTCGAAALRVVAHCAT